MRDDFMTPAWADRHGELSTFVGDLLRQTWIAFERLAALTYDAPWRRENDGPDAPSGGAWQAAPVRAGAQRRAAGTEPTTGSGLT